MSGAGLVARALLMATTTLFLLATAGPPPRCSKPAETVFKIEGSCGPSGLIIVRTDNGPSLTVENAAAAGIPPSGEYSGMNCPAALAAGGWDLEQAVCVSPAALVDGGADGSSSAVSRSDGAVSPAGGATTAADAAGPSGGPTAGTCVSAYRSCSATVITGQLWLTCVTGAAGQKCSSQLTVVP